MKKEKKVDISLLKELSILTWPAWRHWACARISLWRELRGWSRLIWPDHKMIRRTRCNQSFLHGLFPDYSSSERRPPHCQWLTIRLFNCLTMTNKSLSYFVYFLDFSSWALKSFGNIVPSLFMSTSLKVGVSQRSLSFRNMSQYFRIIWRQRWNVKVDAYILWKTVI